MTNVICTCSFLVALDIRGVGLIHMLLILSLAVIDIIIQKQFKIEANYLC